MSSLALKASRWKKNGLVKRNKQIPSVNSHTVPVGNCVNYL